MRAYLASPRKPPAPRLLGGTLLGRLPNGMGALAIVLFVRAHGGGYTLAGVLSALYGLAMAAGQPVLGRAMDRFGQPRILTTGAGAAAARFAMLAAGRAPPPPGGGRRPRRVAGSRGGPPAPPGGAGGGACGGRVPPPRRWRPGSGRCGPRSWPVPPRCRPRTRWTPPPRNSCSPAGRSS